MTRTRKCFVEWPSFEVNILEKLQIFLFTKPSSIKLEVVLGTFVGQTVDIINLDIPGELAHTITSSGTIFREKRFEKDITKQINREKEQLRKELISERRSKIEQRRREADAKEKAAKLAAKTEVVPNISEAEARIELEKKQREEEEAAAVIKRVEEEEKRLEDIKIKNFYTGIENRSPIQGSLFYKSEWHGFGPKLPPSSLDKFEEKKKAPAKPVINLADLNQMYDLNDPRNEYIIEKLKELKNQQINELLLRDERMPFYEIQSLRQRLYELRLSDPVLNEIGIPLLQHEIAFNKRLIQFLEVLYYVAVYLIKKTIEP